MEKSKNEKISKMLDRMSDYSDKQPKEIGDLCRLLFVSPAYAPAMNLLVEAFLSVRSFCILMFEGLISNASAILRILIEQVSILNIICHDEKAMGEYLKFQGWKKRYYGSTGKDRQEGFEFLSNQCGKKTNNAIKNFLDYGWIRITNPDKSNGGKTSIIKKAHLEETLVDIEEQLNGFAHGQKSIFEFHRNESLTDKYVSRIVMIAGKLFIFLVYDKQVLLKDEQLSNDKYFDTYIEARIMFLDLNARAINERIIDYIKQSNNLDNTIKVAAGGIQHMRGLIYSSEISLAQSNFVAKSYVLELINATVMVLYKLYSNERSDLFKEYKSLKNLICSIGGNTIKEQYNSVAHTLSFETLIDEIDKNNDDWRLIESNGSINETKDNFLTDFNSLFFLLLAKVFPDIDEKEDLLKEFVPID